MIFNLTKKIQLLLMTIILIMPILAAITPSQAAGSDLDLWGGKQDDIQGATGLPGDDDTDPRVVAANVLRIVMGFLGIITVAIILWGGFLWMTSGGNDTKAAEGRKWILNGIIGLLIVLSAFIIANFVISKLTDDVLR